MTHLTGFNYMMLVFVGGSPNAVSEEAKEWTDLTRAAGSALDVNRYGRNGDPTMVSQQARTRARLEVGAIRPA